MADAVDGVAASTISPGPTSYLPEDPTTLREAQASPEWCHWQRSLKHEMDRRISRGVWKIVDHREGKTVLDVRLVFKTKIGKDGHVEK